MASKDRVDRALVMRDRNTDVVEIDPGYTFQPQDDYFYLVDGTTKTKRVKFQLSGLTAATDRVVTMPDFDFTLGSGAGSRMGYLLGSANLTLTAAMSGSLIECGAAEDFVLPALTAATIGVWYEFVVTTTATSLTITAGAADLLHGGVTIMSTGAGVENDAFSADGSDDLVLSMNGTTQGGIIGSRVRFVAASATKWIVTGNLIGSGTIITPFS
jgi:hypothetical protein